MTLLGATTSRPPLPTHVLMTRAGRPVITDDQSEIVRGTFTRIESGVKDPAPRVSSVFVLKPDYSSTFASDLRLFKIPWHVTTVASEADAFFEPEGPGISFRGKTPDGRITRHTRYWIVGGQLFEVRAPNIRLVFFEVKPPAVGPIFLPPLRSTRRKSHWIPQKRVSIGSFQNACESRRRLTSGSSGLRAAVCYSILHALGAARSR
jgi:hypothetical protein